MNSGDIKMSKGMSKSQSRIFSRLKYFPYIVYVRKVKISKAEIATHYSERYIDAIKTFLILNVI